MHCTVAGKEVKEAIVCINDHFIDAHKIGKFHHINDDGVSVDIKHEKVIVHGNIHESNARVYCVIVDDGLNRT